MGPPNSISSAADADEDTVPAGADTGPRIDIADPGNLLPRAARTWLEERGAQAVGTVALTGEVRVRILPDADMAAAHQRHCGLDHTTDVLTFDLSDAPPGAPADVGAPSSRTLDADLLLCADEADRQAAARGHTTEQELLLYLLHGALHCLGHDDHDEARAALMHAVEDRVLTAIGVGATYSREQGGTP